MVGWDVVSGLLAIPDLALPELAYEHLLFGGRAVQKDGHEYDTQRQGAEGTSAAEWLEVRNKTGRRASDMVEGPEPLAPLQAGCDIQRHQGWSGPARICPHMGSNPDREGLHHIGPGRQPNSFDRVPRAGQL